MPAYRTAGPRHPTAPEGGHYAAVSVIDDFEFEPEPPSSTSAATSVGGTASVSGTRRLPDFPGIVPRSFARARVLETY